MKKIFLLILMIAGLAIGAVANSMDPQSGFPMTSDHNILNVNLAQANTFYTLTFTTPVVWFNLQAKGGDVHVVKTSGNFYPRWTLSQNSVFSDHFPLPLPENTTITIWTNIAGASLECWYGVR